MMTFDTMGLGPHILDAIENLGFATPTPVQEKVIPFVLQNQRDLIALAQTGTGKTAAFGLPILEQVSDKKNVQALILAPTRELCIQISKDMLSFARFKPEINIVPVYGGEKIELQINKLKRGAQIVVGTPGRLNDMLRRKYLDGSSIKWLVLDEADEMLTMGCREELESILMTTPDTKQTLLFSATMPDSLKDNFMKNPEEIVIGKRNAGNTNIEHRVYMVKSPDRYLALKRVVDNSPDIYGIVFCRTRNETKEISDKLIKDGYSCDALHGELTQAQRDHVMKRFREKHLRLLIATDVAARGLDVNDLTHVINYNLPDDVEVYTHRSGRTGRAGKTGISAVIVNTREQRKIEQIERTMKIHFERALVPGGREICETRLFDLISRVEEVKLKEEQINSFIEPIIEKLSVFERDELIKRFVSVEFNTFLEYYKNAKDINAKSTGNSRDRGSGFGRRDSSSRFSSDKRRTGPGRSRNARSEGSANSRPPYEKKRKPDESYSRMYMNAGRKDGIGVVDLISLLKEKTRVRNIEVGKVDIMDKLTFFEVLKKDEKLVVSSMKNTVLGSRAVRVEPADENKTVTAKGKSSGKSKVERSSKPKGASNKPAGSSRKKD